MRVLIFICFLSLSKLFLTQSELYFDSLTYYQFISNQYKNVIKTGKKALEKNKDFYYLRYRLAFAYFERKNYIKSIENFKKMLEMNPDDVLAQEFLYYCYLELGMKENALTLSDKFPEFLKDKLKINSIKNLDYLSLNYGYLNNSNVKKNENTNHLNSNKGASQNILVDNLNIFDISLNSFVKKRSQLFFQSSFFLSNSKSIGFVDTTKYEFYNKNNNYQLNFVYSYLGKRNWKIASGIAYFYNSSPLLINNKPKYDNNGILISKPFFTDSTLKYNSCLFSLSFEKIGKFLQPYFAFSYANLYDISNTQLSIGTSYFPFGSYKLYGKSMMYFLFQGKSSTKKAVFHQVLGVKLFKNLWAESVFMFGEMQNINTNNGILTLNTSDPMKINIGIDLLWRFKKISFSPSYRFQEREFSTFIIKNSKSSFLSTKYSNHLINFTVKWHF